MRNAQSNSVGTDNFNGKTKEELLAARRTRRLIRTAYRVEQIAELVGITPKQVRRNIRRGNLEAVKVGVPYFVSRSNFNRFQRARAS